MKQGTGIAALSLVLALFAGCAKDPARPLVRSVSGDVVDAAGQPVSGAWIRLEYTVTPAAAPGGRTLAPNDIPDPVPAPSPTRAFWVDNNPCSTGTVAIHFSAPHDNHSTLQVDGRNGVVRRLLADRAFAAGIYTLAWDGRDDTNQPLPPDVYVVRWTDVEGDSTFTFSANLLWQPESPDDGFNARSAADGSFTLDLADLPIGAAFEQRDLIGVSDGMKVVGWPIEVVVTAEVGGVTLTGRATLEESRAGERLRITVR